MEAKNPTIAMEFDMNTIVHLGLNAYSTLPPVLGELVANCWDADAKTVLIKLNDLDEDNKEIIVTDNGHGMTLDDINQKLLRIGRNRRKEEHTDTTPSGRKVIGKKGIGKLSVFGIAEEVEITTIRNHIQNKFRMNFNDIRESGNIYYPEHLIQDKEVKRKQGTVVKLSKIKRKSKFDVDGIVNDLTSRFLIYDKDFQVSVEYNGGKENRTRLTNQMRFNRIPVQFSWDFPNGKLKSDYIHKDKVKGTVYTSTKSVPTSMAGIFLIARGKLVHTNSFYDLKTWEYSTTYMTGWLEVDFIDEGEEDLISTNRESLNWETEKTYQLKMYIQQILKFVNREWREKRKKKKKERIEKQLGTTVEKWIEKLPKTEQKTASKITNMIISSESLDDDKSVQLIANVRDSFQFETFREFAAELEDFKPENQELLLQFFYEWELMEAKELHRLAIVRIEAIRKFQLYIDRNAKEVPTIHNFFKQFSWLLDPRIMRFDDEETYSNILRKNFIEDVELESNRRIDFLCVDFANTIFIIELKRPNIKVSKKELEQALEYRTFLKKYVGNTMDSVKNFETYIIAKGLADNDLANELADSLESSRKVFVRTYTELLHKARQYHLEFVNKYEMLQNKREAEREKD